MAALPRILLKPPCRPGSTPTPGPKSGPRRATIYALGARVEGRLVSITHYLFHDHAWSPKQVCYLQDLYVDSNVRGGGIGKALIEAVAQIARERDCLRLYWTTKEDNARARRLYDYIAKFNGFIRYDYSLG